MPALKQIPVIRLLAGQTGAVDAALLAGAHADGLSVLHIADGIGLGIFQRNEGHDHVDLRPLQPAALAVFCFFIGLLLSFSGAWAKKEGGTIATLIPRNGGWG